MFQSDNIDSFVQNMRDAGCSEEDVLCFCECKKKCNKKEELSILETHRKKLLCEIHEIQDRIEILEELVRGGTI